MSCRKRRLKNIRLFCPKKMRGCVVSTIGGNKLVRRKNGLHYVNNPLTKISDQFEFAPKNSLRSQIWSKLLKRTGGNTTDFLIQGFTKQNDPKEYMRKRFRQLDQRNYVLIGIMGTYLLKEFLCGISPQNELWQVSFSLIFLSMRFCSASLF